jgi:hypothetical protein
MGVASRASSSVNSGPVARWRELSRSGGTPAVRSGGRYPNPAKEAGPEMVPRRGLEPPTYRLGICCSVLMSYRGLMYFMFRDIPEMNEGRQ